MLNEYGEEIRALTLDEIQEFNRSRLSTVDMLGNDILIGDTVLFYETLQTTPMNGVRISAIIHGEVIDIHTTGSYVKLKIIQGAYSPDEDGYMKVHHRNVINPNIVNPHQYKEAQERSFALEDFSEEIDNEFNPEEI